MTRLFLVLAAIAATRAPTPVDAQALRDTTTVRCEARRSADTSLVGQCLQGQRRVAKLLLRLPQAATPYLWLGSVTGEGLQSASGGPVRVSELGIDVRATGAIRLGRDWLRIEHVAADTASIEFSFKASRVAPANEVDIEILRRTRQFLQDPARWNSVDTTDMGAAPIKGFSCAPATRQSLFCALYIATIEVSGDYAHFRPAIDAIRQSIHGSYRHPLVDFNNAPGRTLTEILSVVDTALARAQRNRSIDRP